MTKAFVLLSGGLDSTTLLYRAVRLHGVESTTAILFDYGQRHSVELLYARHSLNKLNIPIHQRHIIDLTRLIPSTALTDPNMPIPDKSYAEIEGTSPMFVPFRNGLMLSAAASYAHSVLGNISPQINYEGILYFGAHAEDAHRSAYPDCTPDFCNAMAKAIRTATSEALHLSVPFQYSMKADIVIEGHHYGVDWRDTWSCYAGGKTHCGRCPTCRARKEAFLVASKDAGETIIDPTIYQS